MEARMNKAADWIQTGVSLTPTQTVRDLAQVRRSKVCALMKSKKVDDVDIAIATAIPMVSRDMWHEGERDYVSTDYFDWRVDSYLWQLHHGPSKDFPTLQYGDKYKNPSDQSFAWKIFLERKQHSEKQQRLKIRQWEQRARKAPSSADAAARPAPAQMPLPSTFAPAPKNPIPAQAPALAPAMTSQNDREAMEDAKLRHEVWGHSCSNLKPFAGCGPFEIPLTEVQRRHSLIPADTLEIVNRYFRDVEITLVEEKAFMKPNQYRLRVWFVQGIARHTPGALNQLTYVWRLLAEFHQALARGEKYNLRDYIWRNHKHQRKADKDAIRVAMAPFATIDNDMVAIDEPLMPDEDEDEDGSMVLQLSSVDNAPKDEPAIDVNSKNVSFVDIDVNGEPLVSSGDLDLIHQDATSVCTSIDFHERVLALRTYAEQNPRGLALRSAAIMYLAVKYWRDCQAEDAPDRAFIESILRGIIL